MDLFSKNRLEIHLGNNLEIMKELPYSFRLVWTDPPFNTKKQQSRSVVKFKKSEEGNRVGFKGKTYKSETIKTMSYADSFDDLSEFLFPRVAVMYDKLTDDGSVVIHLDYREVHDVKVFVMDKIFGRRSFMNEIIWAYDYGAKSTVRWPAKHDTMLWYVKDPKNYVFNFDEIDRIPYMAPGLVSEEKAARGKTITDVWWHTIVCGKEKTGYPTQKPRILTDRFIKMNTELGDYVLDPFAGSGTLGISALEHERNCVLIDESEDALGVMDRRLERWNPIVYR